MDTPLKNILSECHQRGLRLRPHRGRLEVSPIMDCPESLAAALKEYRAAVLAWICRNRFYSTPRRVLSRRRLKLSNRRIVFP